MCAQHVEIRVTAGPEKRRHPPDGRQDCAKTAKTCSNTSLVSRLHSLKHEMTLWQQWRYRFLSYWSERSSVGSWGQMRTANVETWKKEKGGKKCQSAHRTGRKAEIIAAELSLPTVTVWKDR